MKTLTIVLPHFCNRGMFAEQQRVWADYPAEIRKRIHVIVVDDCSPEGQQIAVDDVKVSGLGSMVLYRLTEKKRWNWLACRNLGAFLAKTEWLLLTDIDHVLPFETLRHLLDRSFRREVAYRFKRVTASKPWPYRLADCEPYKPHNDTWLMTRELFFHDKVYGYDERLSGCYGTSGEFTGRVSQTASALVILDQVMVRYPREVIPDASTSPSVYTRKNDPVNDAELAKRKADREKQKDWRPLHRLTPSERVL